MVDKYLNSSEECPADAVRHFFDRPALQMSSRNSFESGLPNKRLKLTSAFGARSLAAFVRRADQAVVLVESQIYFSRIWGIDVTTNCSPDGRRRLD